MDSFVIGGQRTLQAVFPEHGERPVWGSYAPDALMVMVIDCGLRFSQQVCPGVTQKGGQALRNLHAHGFPFATLVHPMTGGNLLHIAAGESWSYNEAERRGTERLIDLLVEWGVDPTARDNKEQRPEDINGSFSAQLRRHREAREQAAPQMALF